MTKFKIITYRDKPSEDDLELLIKTSSEGYFIPEPIITTESYSNQRREGIEPNGYTLTETDTHTRFTFICRKRELMYN